MPPTPADNNALTQSHSSNSQQNLNNVQIDRSKFQHRVTNHKSHSVNNQNRNYEKQQYSVPIHNRYECLSNHNDNQATSSKNQSTTYSPTVNIHQHTSTNVNSIEPFIDHSKISTAIHNRYECSSNSNNNQTAASKKLLSTTCSPNVNIQQDIPTTMEHHSTISQNHSTVNTPQHKSSTKAHTNNLKQYSLPNENPTNNNKNGKLHSPPVINSIKNEDICGPKATIVADILGDKHSVLLDTGSQINAISKHRLPPRVLADLAPPVHTITSYTGNEVDIEGTFITDVMIGNITLLNCYFYVSRDNRRTIIGTPAIKANNVIIDLSKNLVTQDDHNEFLDSSIDLNQVSTSEMGLTKTIKPRKVPPVQMQSMNEIIIPKKSTKFIKLQTRYPIDKAAHYATLDTFDHNLETGILIGNGSPTGEAFLNLQKTILDIRNRGIVLAVSSKLLPFFNKFKTL